LLTGGRPRLLRVHRLAGRVSAVLVLLVLVPSGLVMAREAYAGQIAAAGFAALAIATATYMAATVYFAWQREFQRHRRFAIGTFILLASPLILRLASGAAIITGLESEAFYQVNAWVSWAVPLAIYEAYWAVGCYAISRWGMAEARKGSRLKPAKQQWAVKVRSSRGA
jgi:hypothetical protein